MPCIVLSFPFLHPSILETPASLISSILFGSALSAIIVDLLNPNLVIILANSALVLPLAPHVLKTYILLLASSNIDATSADISFIKPKSKPISN